MTPDPVIIHCPADYVCKAYPASMDTIAAVVGVIVALALIAAIVLLVSRR